MHLRNRPLADDLNLRELAFETQRFSGAQLANLVNLAASFAGKEGRDSISQADMLQVCLLPLLLSVATVLPTRYQQPLDTGHYMHGLHMLPFLSLTGFAHHRQPLLGQKTICKLGDQLVQLC